MNLLDIALNKQNTLNTAPAQNKLQPEANAAIHAHKLLKAAADKFEPIATIGLIRPDRPKKSAILHEPLYKEPVNFLIDIKENLVNIKRGITGKSNDHDLGRINDFAMKAGALGLAGYLFTRGKTVKTRAMEFVGFGAFFASMALWPKLFIQAPLKAMYGLDIHQRYIDNEGRKKMFFQDPQYIPWDLYSQEELSKLGDRFGIPNDIHNRNEVIKKKAHKIALQGNTLWMLTAGFATPLLCALGCNGLERLFNPPSEKKGFPRNIVSAVATAIEKGRIEKAESAVKNADSITAKKLEKYDPKKLNTILKLHKGHELDDKTIAEITGEITHDTDLLLKEYVEKQIKDIVKKQEPKVTQEYVGEFYQYIKKYSKSYPDIDFSYLSKELFETSVTSGKIEDFNNKILMHLEEAMGFDDSEPVQDVFINLSREFFDKKSARVLSSDNVQNLRHLDRKLYEYSIKKGLLDKYNLLYFNNEAETIAVNRWNNTANAFFKTLGLNNKEIAEARLGEDGAYKIVLQRLEKLVSDEEAYKKAFSKVYAAVLDFDKTILPDAADGTAQGIKAVLKSKYTKFFDDYAKIFEDAGYQHIKERLVGNKVTSLGCLKDNTLDAISRRIFELRNGMYKFLHVLDFFKRANDAGKEGSKFAQEYFSKSIAYNGINLKPSQETLLKDLKKYKALLLKGTIADYTTKSGMKNSQIGLYNRMMKMIFNTDFADSTKAIIGVSDDAKKVQLGNTNFVDSFIKKINDTLSNLGNFVYPHADKVTLKNVPGGGGDILVRDSLAGPRIDKVVRETASQVYNTSKWLKMFGGAAAALVGITLLSETFFGRLEPEEINIKKDKQ